jgi:hypothetical protein
MSLMLLPLRGQPRDLGCARVSWRTCACTVPDTQVIAKGDVAVFVQRSSVSTTPNPDPARGSEPTRWLECLQCNQKVTRTSDRLEIDGKHEQAFINPVGVIYRIGCFGSAPGVVEVGEPSGHFTWFAGHLWRIALCARCEQHLGWGFHAGDASFFGLVLAELKEAT